MNESLSPYLTFALWFGGIVGFVGITLLMNAALGPKPKPTAVKLEPFECGATPVDARNVRPIAVKYYGIAIAFILFDLETVFLILWALAAKPLSDFMMATFLIFTVLLVIQFRRRRAVEGGRFPPWVVVIYAISLVTVAGLWLNAAGTPFAPSVGPYAVTLTWALCVFGFIFVRTIDIFLSRARS